MRGESVHLASRIDEVFTRFIDHYLREDRCQLVVNGDFIDFWNVDLPGDHELSGEALAVRRLHAVLDAHPAVEDGLARFLAVGNSIVFVAGNHDAELLYPGVQRALAQRLMPNGVDAQASITLTGMVRLTDIRPGRIRFVRWFLREEGGAWIEHGHQFDPACRTPAHLSPTRSGRLVQTVAEVATRSFSNLMPEIAYDAPDRFSTMDYVRWAFARGLRFVLRVLLLYLRMVGRVLVLWASTGRVDKAGKAEHERRLRSVADNAGLQMSTLDALERMAPPPGAATVVGVLTITSLDKLLAVLIPGTLAVGLGRLFSASALMCAAAGLTATALAFAYMSRRPRKRHVAADMAAAAAQVGHVTGAPLVVMGHSHHGTIERRGGVLYANSGSWIDGLHLVVFRDEVTGALSHVELRRWRNGGITRLGRAAIGADVTEQRYPTGEQGSVKREAQPSTRATTG